MEARSSRGAGLADLRRGLILVGLIALLAGCQTQPAPIAPLCEPPFLTEAEIVANPLGSQHNPVRADGPLGQRRYIERLVCKDGEAPFYERLGAAGLGPWGCMLDLYRLQCPLEDEVRIFMDFYHEGFEEQAPVPGFSRILPSGEPG